MLAAVFDRHGGAEELALREVPDPVAGPGQVLLRVRAAGMNYLDVLVRRGMPGVKTVLPFTSGGDIAGEVVALGEGATGWSIGDRVVVNPKTPAGLLGEEVPGGFCEMIAAPATHLVAIPPGIDDVTAAAVPIAFGTALRMLDRIGQVRPGELVLVLGASGGVGTACVQLATARGARVIAAAGSPQKCTGLLAMGAAYAVDTSAEDVSRAAWAISGKRGVDVVVNFTGGDTMQPSLRALRHGGRLLNCGATAGHEVMIDLRFVWRRELQILGSTGYTTQDIAEAMALVAAGTLKPAISHVLPLAEIATAHRLMEDRALLGKIVLRIG